MCLLSTKIQKKKSIWQFSTEFNGKGFWWYCTVLYCVFNMAFIESKGSSIHTQRKVDHFTQQESSPGIDVLFTRLCKMPAFTRLPSPHCCNRGKNVKQMLNSSQDSASQCFILLEALSRSQIYSKRNKAWIERLSCACENINCGLIFADKNSP